MSKFSDFLNLALMVAILVLALETMSFAGSSSTVALNKIANVTGSDIKLGDLADLSRLPHQVDVVTLAALILDAAPTPGKKIEWSASDFVKRIRPYHESLKSVHFLIPKKITVYRVDNRMTEEIVKNKIAEQLIAVSPQSSWDAKILDIQKTEWPEMSSTASWKVIPFTRRPRGPFQAEIVIEDQGQILQHVWINGHVEYQAKVATVKNPIRVNEKITSDDLMWEVKDVTRMTEIPTQEADLNTSVAKQNIYIGTLLTPQYLQQELAVKFGEEVEVKAGNENFSVSSRGVSQQNGHLGDEIRVRSLSGQKTLNGKLVAKGVVQLSY